MNAAESFVTQEGFGRDAVALPIDEQGQPLTQSPVSEGIDPNRPLLNELLKDAPKDSSGGVVDVDTGETLSPLAAFLTHAALEAGDNQAQAGQDAVQLMTVHASKGLEFDCVFIGGWKKDCSRTNAMSDRDGLEEERRSCTSRSRAHEAPLPEPFADAHAAWPDALSHQEPLLRPTARSALKWLTPKQSAFGTYAPDSGGGNGYGANRDGSRSGGGMATATVTAADSIRSLRREPARAQAEGRSIARPQGWHSGVFTTSSAKAGARHRRHGPRCACGLALPTARHEVAGAVGCELTIAE